MALTYRNWEHYYQSRHEGRGTTYERFILHAYFRKIWDLYGVKTVLEAPVFGMTGISGINSIWWAVKGARVTLVDHNRERLRCIENVWRELSLEARCVYDPGTYVSLPFEDGEFDMGWNFASLRNDLDIKRLLGGLARVTQKVIFICLPNRLNLFGLVRRIIQGPTDPLQWNFITPLRIEKIVEGLGWELSEKGRFDAPPWPDIAMNKEDFLRKLGFKSYARRLGKGFTEENRCCILDYYSGRKKEMKRKMGKYAFLENSPYPVKAFWAHHTYLLFTPIRTSDDFRHHTIV